MSEPIAFISRFRVKEGKIGTLKEQFQAAARKLEADKPRTLALLSYVGEDGRLSIVHLFADAEAMDLHFEGADERSAAAMELMDAAGWEIYGTPSDDVLNAMRRLAASYSVPLTLQPEFVVGFLRLAPAG